MHRRITVILAMAVIVIVATAVIALATKGPAVSTTSPTIVPQPLAIEVTGGEGAALGEPATSIDPQLGAEAYSLSVTTTGVEIVGGDEAGVFYGIQSLRQLTAQSSDGTVPALTITDRPRFAYRGAMLDVARHFFSVDDVKRYIDDIALLKFNHLHLHLTDDQGWRIHIEKWPNLTAYGSTTAVGGAAGGFYTADDYREIVDYAASRFVTIVPEIDMPGHTNAALASYPELTCDGVAPELYTGIEVGFSSLCIRSERTYEFVADVLGEVAAMTPGRYLHVGGDESLSTSDEDFLYFAQRASAIAASTGKTVVAWHELGKSADLPQGSVGQYWGFVTPEGESAAEAASFVEQGGSIILSPADVTYLDMKYDASSRLGLEWAKGPTSVTEAGSWEPTKVLDIDESSILGIEAPLWSETLESIKDVEYMAFPRLAAIADIAWSPRETDRSTLPARLANFGALLDAERITYFRAPDVPWVDAQP